MQFLSIVKILQFPKIFKLKLFGTWWWSGDNNQEMLTLLVKGASKKMLKSPKMSF